VGICPWTFFSDPITCTHAHAFIEELCTVSAGLCYIEARGVKRDAETGLEMYQKGSGFSKAQSLFKIALWFGSPGGLHGTPNWEKAGQYAQRAVDEGHQVFSMVMEFAISRMLRPSEDFFVIFPVLFTCP
jgi:hypothetical protein